MRKSQILFKKNLVLLSLLGVSLLVRIYKINSPLIGQHSWRQTDTAAISRNYYENGYRFCFPQVDWGGNTAGIVETEFPVYSFLVALLYRIFGVSDFLGRFLSAIFSLITIYFLYLLVLKITNRKTALWAAFFFSISPPVIFCSRSFQPESGLLMSLVLGIYFFVEWIGTQKTGYLLSSAVFVSLACLLKIPSLYLGLPILYLAWLKYKKKIFKTWTIWVYGLIVLLPVVLWYYHAHQIYLTSGLTFGVWGYGTDKWGNWQLVATLKFWNRILFQNLVEDYLAWVGFAYFIIGIWLKRRSEKERLFDVWMVALLVYVIVVASGNYYHLYYQLPIMIPASLFAGKALSRFLTPDYLRSKKSSLLIVSLIGMIALSAGRYRIYLAKENPEKSDLYKIAQIAKQRIAQADLVIAIDNNDPTLLYLSGKKGWHAFPKSLSKDFIEERARKGARYIIGLQADFKDDPEKKAIQWLSSNYPLIFGDRRGFIFEISNRRYQNNATLENTPAGSGRFSQLRPVILLPR